MSYRLLTYLIVGSILLILGSCLLNINKDTDIDNIWSSTYSIRPNWHIGGE